MLGSNNYLGLTADQRVHAGRARRARPYGTGLTGSRLLNGTLDLHLELERELAEWMGTEEAIVFTTGHQANVGTLGTILGPGDTVIADSGDHASILDGCLLSRAKLRPFRHNRLDKLEKMLERAGDDGGGVLVVVDGVFSMEGDVAPLPRIVELCERLRRAADGRRGARRRRARRARRGRVGAVRRRGPTSTCGWARSRKSLASCGGFIAGPHEVIDFLRISSRARSCSPRPACPPRSARRWPRCGSSARTRGRSCSRACSTTPRYLQRRAARRSASRSSRRDARRSRRSCRSWSATTGRPCCSGARSTTPASTSTSRSTRPSRPAARCCARA